MKILHIINSMAAGGAETLLIQSASLYLSKGLEVEVLLLNDDPTKRADSFSKNNPKIRVHRLHSRNIYNPLMIIKVIPFVRGNYDVIHVHLFPSSYWTVLAKILCLSRTKLVFTEHSTYNRRRDNLLFRFLDKRIYNYFEHIIAISEATKRNLIDHIGWKHRNKISVIPNGIDLTRFNRVTSPFYDFFSQESKILIQVSSFRPQKDQETLVKSLQKLPEYVKLLLVGDGPKKKSIEELTEKLGIRHRVKFLGIRSDIPELISYADIVVLSSNHEGFGLAIVEGMASKKPSIASNIDGVSEIVENHGILFERGNDEDLALKVKLLLQDQLYYDTVASKCFQRAKEYDIKYMVNRYIEVYKSIKSLPL